jgi:HAD superfamily hydrolase (TIGR01509 family)
MNLEKIDCFLFDMDGLLIDSEPLWKKAEKEVFGALGLNLTDDLLRQVMGFRLNEVVQHWFHYQAWENPNFEATEQAIIDCMIAQIQKEGKAMEGVYELLEVLKSKNKKIALASSSSMVLIETVVKKLQLNEWIPSLFSAEHEAFGKPHPGIFIRAAASLQVEARNCMVLEDSLNGMLAAKSARMACTVVPDPVQYDRPEWCLSDFKFKKINELIPFLNA